MSQIMKTYLGLFILLVMSFTAAGFLGAYLQVMAAQNMHARIIDELENSHFYKEVVQESFREAEDSGYQLSIVFYQSGVAESVNSGRNLNGDYSNTELAKVSLSFPFEIAFLGLNQTQTFTGYAR